MTESAMQSDVILARAEERTVKGWITRQTILRNAPVPKDEVAAVVSYNSFLNSTWTLAEERQATDA